MAVGASGACGGRWSMPVAPARRAQRERSHRRDQRQHARPAYGPGRRNHPRPFCAWRYASGHCTSLGRAGAVPEQAIEGLEGRLHVGLRVDVRIKDDDHLTVIEGHILPIGQDDLAAVLIGALEAPDAVGAQWCRRRARPGIAFAARLRLSTGGVGVADQGLHAGMHIQAEAVAFGQLILADFPIGDLPRRIRPDLPAVPLAVDIPEGNAEGRGAPWLAPWKSPGR